MYKINCRCHKTCPEKCEEEMILDTTCMDVMSEYDNKHDECACGFNEEEAFFTNNPMLGHAYVPRQRLERVFTPCVGLKMGTMFPELVSQYVPCQSIEENEFLRIREMEECKNGIY